LIWPERTSNVKIDWTTGLLQWFLAAFNEPIFKAHRCNEIRFWEVSIIILCHTLFPLSIANAICGVHGGCDFGYGKNSDNKRI